MDSANYEIATDKPQPQLAQKKVLYDFSGCLSHFLKTFRLYFGKIIKRLGYIRIFL